MRFEIFGVPVSSLGMDELLDEFTRGLLVFHNLDTLRKVRRHSEFAAVCRTSEFAVIDGQVLRFLISVLWQKPTAKVSGSDFLPRFCEHHASDGASVFLLGAAPGVAEHARSALNERIGKEIVVGSHSPSFGLLDDDEETSEVIRLIDASGADTLAVGLGAPKQELWMARNRHRFAHVTRLIAVGATLDFEAGRVSRAPRWMSQLGLEWLYRLTREPQRLWRRYLVEGPQVVMAIVGYRAAGLGERARRSSRGREETE